MATPRCQSRARPGGGCRVGGRGGAPQERGAPAPLRTGAARAREDAARDGPLPTEDREKRMALCPGNGGAQAQGPSAEPGVGAAVARVTGQWRQGTSWRQVRPRALEVLPAARIPPLESGKEPRPGSPPHTAQDPAFWWAPLGGTPLRVFPGPAELRRKSDWGGRGLGPARGEPAIRLGRARRG